MKEKGKITKKWISTIGGICFILLTLVILFSSNTPFKFLSNLLTHSLGFVGFWLLLPFVFVIGLYLILEKKIIKIKLGVELWGVFIIIICLLVISSHWASWGIVIDGIELTGKNVTTDIGAPRYLTFSNSIPVFNKIVETNPIGVGPNPKLGGGKVGFILAGAINSAITPLGLNIVSWIFFVGGLIMITNRQIKRFFRFLKNRKHAPKREKISRKESKNLDDEYISYEEPTYEEAPILETGNEKPIFESSRSSSLIDNNYDLKKAHLVLSDDGTATLESQNEEISKPTFEPHQSFDSSRKAFGFEEQKPEIIKEETKPKEYSEPFFEPLQDKEEEIEEEIIEQNFEIPTPMPTPSTAPIREEIPQVVSQQPVEKEVDFAHKPQPKAHLMKNYIFPSIDLLNKNEAQQDNSKNEESCLERTAIINTKLANLGIGAQVVSHTIGPSVTRFDLQTNDDVSVTAIQKYVPDLAVKLGGLSVRFEPIVAGKSTSGLEIPNDVRTNVTLRESIEGLPQGDKYKLTIPFGKSISGELKFADLTDFPHLLVAGTTGSGKSIFVHATIISLLMRNTPDNLKLIMVDPKKVEMNYYDNIPHLLCPVISDMKKVLTCFNKLVDEMERRYNLLSSTRLRDIKGFNLYAKEHNLQPLPYIVVFIDEYADLIETCKEIRTPVVRIVQKARAAGIHMVFATQRPSVNVIDGVIKANVSTRVALMCASATDSLTVIGEGGAEKLLGNGDMLIDCSLISKTMKTRAQGCYVSEKEITRVCDFLREHYQPQFDPMFLNLEPVVEKKEYEEVEAAKFDKEQSDEEIYQKIKDDATHREYFSISHITRTYGMGFSRAGKIFTRLQKEGIVALSGTAKGCKVLVYVPQEQSVGSFDQSTYVPDDGSEE